MVSDFDKVLRASGVPRAFGYEFYFRNYIFESVELKNKSLCDIGGGNGIASFFAQKYLNASEAVVVDPLGDGSNQMMRDQFENFSRNFGSHNVSLFEGEINEYPDGGQFDCMLLHNSINHIGEDLIQSLFDNPKSLEEYTLRLQTIFSFLKKGGTLIIADCSSSNFWGDFNLYNPIAPNIEWHLHIKPKGWIDICTSLGLSLVNDRWTARREFGFFGKNILAKKMPSYFLDSHFVLQFIKR